MTDTNTSQQAAPNTISLPVQAPDTLRADLRCAKANVGTIHHDSFECLDALDRIFAFVDTVLQQQRPSVSDEPHVLVSDMTQSSHPEFGAGLFCTSDCVKPGQARELTDERIDGLADRFDLYGIQDGGRVDADTLRNFTRAALAQAAPSRQEPVAAQPQEAGQVPNRSAILEEAARACEKIAEERFAEHGTREWDTGATYYSGRCAEEYDARDEEDAECAAAIRALKGGDRG